MKLVDLSKVKDSLSRYVELVRRGARVRILVRGKPAADLVPVSAASSGGDGGAELDELERRGLIRRGPGGLDPELLRPAPRARGKPLSTLLIEARRR